MLYTENKVKIGVWLQPEVIANCDFYAEYFSQSRSNFLNEALKLYIKQLEKHCELISEKTIENTEPLAAQPKQQSQAVF